MIERIDERMSRFNQINWPNELKQREKTEKYEGIHEWINGWMKEWKNE